MSDITSPSHTPQVKPIDRPGNWFKAVRSREAEELIRNKRNHNAYLLALVIASRARWVDSFNADGLEPGEALLGDFAEYGMTRQEYRTAIKQLTKWHFATFHSTSLGTIAKLTDSRLFDVSVFEPNQQSNQRLTIGQPSSNQRLTTNKNVIRKESIEIKEGESSTSINGNSEALPRVLTASERISLEKELERLEAERQEIRGQGSCVAGGDVIYDDTQRARLKWIKERKAAVENALFIPIPKV